MPSILDLIGPKSCESGQNEPTGMLGRVSSWIRENF